jgi:hypothetical protein
MQVELEREVTDFRVLQIEQRIVLFGLLVLGEPDYRQTNDGESEGD